LLPSPPSSSPTSSNCLLAEIANVAAESRAAVTFVHVWSLSLTTLVNAREGSIDTDRYLQNLGRLASIDELDAKHG
jgi:hypothetical protein